MVTYVLRFKCKIKGTLIRENIGLYSSKSCILFKNVIDGWPLSVFVDFKIKDLFIKGHLKMML